MRRWATVSLASLALASACSFDWDTYDPRLGDAPDASSGGSSGSAGSGSGGIGGAGAGGVGGSSGGSAGAGGSSASGGSAGASGGSAGAGGSGGSGGGTGGTGGSAGAIVMTAEYTPPGVADCIALIANPDPDDCEQKTGANQMSVDRVNNNWPAGDAATSPSTAAFLSFALDGQIAGKQVLSVTLEVTASNGLNADSDVSGEVWEVAPFTRPDLFNAAPAKQGSSPVAPDQGAVTQLQTVAWPLPTSIVSAGQTLHLGIFAPNSSTNGIDYFGKNGATPPKLIVQFQ